MIRTLLLLWLLWCSASVNAQEYEVYSIYFPFDKHGVNAMQKDSLERFIQKIDSSQVTAYEIYGYCDDRGKDDYNMKLSQRRAAAVEKLMLEAGVKNKIIVSIEGKGRVLIDDDLVDNLPEVRSKNRRVDVVIRFNPELGVLLEIPGVYTSIQKSHVVGDRIYLTDVYFDRGSSKLTAKARMALDKVAFQLQKHKNYHIEIQGHVCCTPTFQKEAIDRDTKKRELSVNRAKAVMNYLKFKKIDLKRMTFKGLGNTQPLGKEAHLDRRVELVISKI